jgi:hypothetical protein
VACPVSTTCPAFCKSRFAASAVDIPAVLGFALPCIRYKNAVVIADLDKHVMTLLSCLCKTRCHGSRPRSYSGPPLQEHCCQYWRSVRLILWTCGATSACHTLWASGSCTTLWACGSCTALWACSSCTALWACGSCTALWACGSRATLRACGTCAALRAG